MIENNEIYIVTDNFYDNSNQIIGYSDSESKAKKFCDDRELMTGKRYFYNPIRNIEYVKNDRPKVVTFKATYDISKDMLNIRDITILGTTKVYENNWPCIEDDNEKRQYFYFEMPIDTCSSKKKILEIARNKADELLDETYKSNIGFMHFINKQILLKEGIIEEADISHVS